MKFSLFFFALLSSAVVEGSTCVKANAVTANGSTKSYTCANGETCGFDLTTSGPTNFSCADGSTCTIADCPAGTGTVTSTTDTSSASELPGVCAAVAVVAVSVVAAIY
ncbi:hypothetical protein TrST_g11244 [Triparma strigata]|uniref:Antifreeze protein n=1 Tax=Triparma strigata TaxID=1606541 RepID=A0A9W7EPY8_9STRA|nr:hypothetical protein TrST_g11244 [Triparma strigata]